MKPPVSFLLTAAASMSLVLAQTFTEDDFGVCVGKCFEEKASDDWETSKCNGSESGNDAVVNCTCASIRASSFYHCAIECEDDGKEKFNKAWEPDCPNIFTLGAGDSDDKKDNKDDSKDDPKDDGKDDSKDDGKSEDKDDDKDDAAFYHAPNFLLAGALIAALFV